MNEVSKSRKEEGSRRSEQWKKGRKKNKRR